MSERPWLDPRSWGDPAADEAREARHQLLADLLAAYVDDELPPETASQLDAHLVGCARCRRDVQLQLAVRDALVGDDAAPALASNDVESAPAAASAALLDRVLAIPETTPVPRPRTPRTTRRHLRDAVTVLAAAALGALGAWLAVAPRTPSPAAPALVESATPAAAIPVAAAALADFTRVAGRDLPGRDRDLATVRAAVGFPVEPLHSPALRLLGVWTTTLDGEPVAVLAYRWSDRLAVQYIVPEQQFFRAAATRAAAGAHRRLALSDGGRAIVAWPVAGAGSLVVAPGSPDELAAALLP